IGTSTYLEERPCGELYCRSTQLDERLESQGHSLGASPWNPARHHYRSSTTKRTTSRQDPAPVPFAVVSCYRCEGSCAAAAAASCFARAATAGRRKGSRAFSGRCAPMARAISHRSHEALVPVCLGSKVLADPEALGSNATGETL